MPKRLASTVRIDASAVQGEGAYVELRKFTWGEAKAVLQKVNELEQANPTAFIDATEQLLIEHLLSWNWVDDAGALLAVPQTPAALNALTSDEIQFLMDTIRAVMRLSEQARKN